MDSYNEDAAFSWVAAHCFTDVPHGRAITEAEYAQRLELLKSYKDEVAQTRELFNHISNFEKLNYKDQINFSANLLVSLKNINEKTNAKAK